MMTENLTFLDCLRECIGIEEFVSQFNRLSGTTLGVDKRAPIERMVDEATGYRGLDDAENEAMKKLVEFVYEFVWMLLVQQEDE